MLVETSVKLLFLEFYTFFFLVFLIVGRRSIRKSRKTAFCSLLVHWRQSEQRDSRYIALSVESNSVYRAV
jgi:hypothetical protein